MAPRCDIRPLSVKVFWGRVCLDSRVFPRGSPVTIGAQPGAGMQISTDLLPDEPFELASPGGPAGHVVQAPPGSDLWLQREGEQARRPAQRSCLLQTGDRARVELGSLRLAVEYVEDPRGVSPAGLAGRDLQMARWWATFFIVAAGLWLMIEATPRAETQASDYLNDPARFSRMIMPASQPEKTARFEAIRERPRQRPALDGQARWKKVSSRSRSRQDGIPSDARRARDRRAAVRAGILALLKERGGGPGGHGGSVLGGADLSDLDAAIEGIARSSMGHGDGFGGMEIRGGGITGSPGLDIDGFGPRSYERGSEACSGSVPIARRGKSDIQVDQQRSRIVGGLSQQVVGRYIERYWAQFKYCYERELARSPDLYGKITTTFTISGSGRVSEAQVLQSSMHNANVEQCLLRAIRRIRFPPPRGGGQVIVTYPFLLRTAG
ncbi:MAG: TonB family protein [Deltaproteobacteria bacterium]|nr:TonB family protein [Deltaproteobacteria bacterium]